MYEIFNFEKLLIQKNFLVNKKFLMSKEDNKQQ